LVKRALYEEHMQIGLTFDEMAAMKPKDLRSVIRRGEIGASNLLFSRGYAQANLAIVPREFAFDFLLYCVRNPRPCPLLEVLEPGSPHPTKLASEADIRTDIVQYRMFKDGVLVDEPSNIVSYWRDDLVSFLLGCSDSFDWSLRAANIRVHLFGVYTTNIACVPAAPFAGPMVVTCRLAKDSYHAVRCVQVTSRHPLSHGAPVHIGDPSTIGIVDLQHPDVTFAPYGVDPPYVERGEIPIFHACGVTPQTAAAGARLPIMITHKAGNMFMTDLLTEELAVF